MLHLPLRHPGRHRLLPGQRALRRDSGRLPPSPQHLDHKHTEDQEVIKDKEDDLACFVFHIYGNSCFPIFKLIFL